MKNLKISSKLAVCFMIVILLTIVPTIASLMTMRSMANTTRGNYETITYPLDEMVRFSMAYGRMHDAMRDLGRVTTDADNRYYAAALEANLDLAIRHLRAYYNIFEGNMFCPTEYEIIRSLYMTMQEYANAIRRYMIPAGLANENDRIFEMIAIDLVPICDAIEMHVETLTDMNSEQGRNSAYMATADLNTGIITSVGMLLAIICVVIALAVYVSGLITKPLHKITAILDEVSTGNLNVNIDRHNIPNDEIGMLAHDACNIIDVVKSIVDDLSKAHHAYMEAGNMHYTIDDSKYQNAFKEVIQQVNNFLTQNTADIMSLKEVLDNISDGNLDVHVKTDDWMGDWAAIPQAINRFTTNLRFAINEINRLAENISSGNFHISVDTSNAKGEWKHMLDKLNALVKDIEEPLTQIEENIVIMADGDFSLLEGDFKGQFKVMQDACNLTNKHTLDAIEEISYVLSHMAKGDLTVSIKGDYVGSYLPIKAALTTILTSLSKTMSEISAASAEVLSASNQISISSMDLANGAQEQANSVKALNETIDMINHQTQQNADNASDASDLSNKSSVNAQEGNQAMKQMLMAMVQIKESSNGISKIIKVIQDIAFQTNLLALNAAVEAARAGDHGKGFSVVAEEVRSLAARSQQSAVETTTLIEDSIVRVDSGSNIAESTSQSLDTIVENVNDVLEIINNIATATKEQAEAIAQFSDGLETISRVVQSNSTISEETAVASEELSSQAELLQQLIAFFKLQ